MYYSRLPDLNQRHFDNDRCCTLQQTTTVKCSTPELNRDNEDAMVRWSIEKIDYLSIIYTHSYLFKYFILFIPYSLFFIPYSLFLILYFPYLPRMFVVFYSHNTFSPISLLLVCTFSEYISIFIVLFSKSKLSMTK